MIHDPTNVFGRLKEFIAYLLLASWALLTLASYVPIGITVTHNPFLFGIPLALALCIAYLVTGGILGLLLRLRQFGRLGEFLLGAICGTGTLWFVSHSEALYGGGMEIEHFTGAIAGGVIGAAIVVALGTITGRLNWDGGAAFPLRKHVVDPNDNRSFESSFEEPVRVQLRHNGRIVFDSVMFGECKLMLRDYAPYSGKTELLVDGEAFGCWQC